MRHLIGSRLWDFYSFGYDFITKHFLSETREKYVESLLTLNSSQKEINNILIIGAGTAESLRFIDPHIAVTVTDYSHKMLAKAKQKGSNFKTIQFIQMDAHSLQFPDSSFDRILMPLILAVVKDPNQALKEAERVLTPGGRLLVFDKFISKDQKPSLARRIINMVSNLFATQVNLDFHQLIKQTSLTLLDEKPVLIKGWFKIFLVEK